MYSYENYNIKVSKTPIVKVYIVYLLTSNPNHHHKRLTRPREQLRIGGNRCPAAEPKPTSPFPVLCPRKSRPESPEAPRRRGKISGKNSQGKPERNQGRGRSGRSSILPLYDHRQLTRAVRRDPSLLDVRPRGGGQLGWRRAD